MTGLTDKEKAAQKQLAKNARRRAMPYLHSKNIDRDAGGTGYHSAPNGMRWQNERLVRR